MGSEDSTDAREAGELARSLAAMKRRGCWLLVTGREPGDGHGHACRRLLGQDGERPRRRIVVETAADRRLGDPAAARGAEARIEVAGGTVRRDGALAEGSTAADVPSAPGRPATGDEPAVPGRPVERVRRSDLAALEDACRERIDALRASADLAPAALRLCVDSLAPLVEANDLEAVASLLDAVGDRVRAARGMGHVHLAACPDSTPVERLGPLFDAVVRVRCRGGRVEHRWHVRDADVTSGWLEL